MSDASREVTPPARKDRAMGEVLKCSVRDGRFVEPCGALEENTDNGMAAFSRAKGLTRWHYTSLETHKPSRTFYGVKTKAHPNGFLFNWCPFCGEKIDAPFVDTGEELPA